MSLANDLLRTLSVEEDDKTLIIDHYARTISIPKSVTTLGVERDDDVLRLNFKMPRYLGTVDLYNFSIRVNYINAEGEDDVYKVTDKAVVGDTITFSWLVGPTATAYKGVTKFNVNMVVTDSNSVIKQEYNTAVVSLPVLEGMETSERVVSEYTDILEQWERRLFGIGDTEEAKLLAFSEEQQENIVEKGAEVLATIPEDYQTTYKLANEGVRSKADAIICSAEGSTVAVSDSSDDHLRGLKILGKTTQVKTTGKNLFDVSKIASNSRVTNNNGAITVSTPEGSSAVDTMTKLGVAAPGLEVGKSYILTFDTTGTSDYIYLEEAKYMISRGKANTFTQEMLDSDILLYASGVSTSATLTNFMIRDASIADASYEPYSGGVASPSPEWPQEMVNLGDDGNIDITVYGKNLITYPYQGASGTINNGITYTVNNDGSITVNGTATANSNFALMPTEDLISLPVGWVYTSLCNGYGSNIVQIQNDIYKDGVYVTTLTNSSENESKRRLTQPHEIRGVRLKVLSGVTVNNAVVYPMLSVAEPITGYEQYRGKQSLTVITENGLPGIPVTSGGNYTDENGQQWICDEIDFERGVYVKRIDKLVLDGTAKWTEYTYETTHYGFMIWDLLSETHYRSPGMSNQFRLVGSGSGECIWVGASNACIYAITNEWYDKGLAAWKAHLNETPLEIIYRSTNPIETPLAADELAAFQALKTNYPNTTVLNDAGAWMNLRYNADTKTWISNLIDSKIAAYLEGVSS